MQDRVVARSGGGRPEDEYQHAAHREPGAESAQPRPIPTARSSEISVPRKPHTMSGP